MTVDTFRVYYADGSVYDGSPAQAPGWGVVVIVQYGGGWWGHDLAGLLDCLAQPGPNIILHGRTVSSKRWPELMAKANLDPDYPKVEGRTLMHSWDHYCWHGGDD